MGMNQTKQTPRDDVRAFLAAVEAREGPRTHELEPPAAREMSKLLKAAAEVDTPKIARIDNLSCPGPAGDIALRVYDARESGAPSSAIVFYHGGGFVINDLDTYEAFCAEMALQMQLPVISVDYRLAPEAPFPAAPDDCEAATRWIADHGDVLGLDITGLIACGDSAGGNLAIVVSQQLRDRPASLPVIAQFPIYPTVDDAGGYQSFKDFSEGYLLTSDTMRYFDGHYAPKRGDPRNACILARHEATPPTLVMTAGLDPLRDQGRAYAGKLIEAGVTTLYYDARGTIHGFITLRKAMPSGNADLAVAFRLLKALIADHG